MKPSNRIVFSFVTIVSAASATAGEAGGPPATAAVAVEKKALKAEPQKKATASADTKGSERALFSGTSGTGKPLTTSAKRKPAASSAK